MSQSLKYPEIQEATKNHGREKKSIASVYHVGSKGMSPMDRYPAPPKKYGQTDVVKSGHIPNTLSYHDDMEKIEKLSMINANARFELLNDNEQLLNF